MAQFLKGSTINSRLERIFESAQRNIIIISPYIKLHSKIKEVLRDKRSVHKVQLTMVFGKNEEDLSKSLNKDDFTFLSEFPNVEILHEPRLHAKYYANENSALLSSMNLYDYSQNNNIEFGVYVETSTISFGGNSLDADAFDYFAKVIDNSQCLFRKIPKYEKGIMGIGRKYLESEIQVDHLSEIYGETAKKSISANQINQSISIKGYCIRTGEEIPFNPDRPMSSNAFRTWNRYGDENYPEKYCHFSGEESNGETTYAKPILRKNWNEAKKYF